MKHLKRLSIASMLIFVLSAPTLAGIIEMPAPTPPPPGSSSTVTAGETAKPGDIYIPGAPSDSVTDAALNLLQAFLTVF